MNTCRRRRLLIAAGIVSPLASLSALAQQEKRVRRIVFLSQQAPEVLSAFATEVVASQPDLLLTTNDLAAMALAKNTKSIPIVFGISPDPVASGLARKLQRPGGNLTGMTTMVGELGPKRLEVLRDAVPGMAHIAVLFEPANAATVAEAKAIEQAALRRGLRVTPIELRQVADIAPAFKGGAAPRVNAYVGVRGALLTISHRVLADAALQFKIPGITANGASVDAGGLLSYGPANDDNFRRAAAYVDKIFKGAKAGDLAIEQPVKFDLMVNMKTAKAMGLSIAQTFLLRADRVIE